VDLLTAPRRVARTAWRSAHGISYRRRPSFAHPISQPCTYEQVLTPEYAAWCSSMSLPPLRHRKLWEWCYILQTLEVSGMARGGRHGLGFGVGTEPITAMLAARGCTLVATDLPEDAPRADEWQMTDQHAERLADLNGDGHCPDDAFAQRVSFRPVDMNAIPSDLRGFDFTWSSCAFEHLGSHEAGIAFIENQLACLKPGGIGVHTTEFAVENDLPTLDSGHTVLYRRRELEALTHRVRAAGHHMRITFALGNAPQDLHVDKRPYSDIHIRTETYDHVHTSFGIVVRKRAR
jgi:hypothetical protein